MSRKIKRRGRTTHQPSVSKASPSPPPAARGISLPTDTLMEIIEKVVGKVKKDLISTGKIRPTAFFAYPDGAIKVASLSYRDDAQKETQIERVREKVVAEQASAVLLFSELELPGTALLLSAATHGESVCAIIDCTLDGEAKRVASWSMTWVDDRAHGSFLEGIFGRTV